MRSHPGFTLVELVIVIILAGILATIAILRLGRSVDTARYEHTKKELEQLAMAIVGNPAAHSNGVRSDFGYVGDVGALPPNLDALVGNPGGYSTWAGPYISANFGSDDFKTDAWGVEYIFTGTLLRSTGSGSNIDMLIAAASSELLNNTVSGHVVDAGNDQPGDTYRDSVRIEMTYPDGSGNLTTAAVNPLSSGNFSFSNVPIGNQTLRIIYLPDSDTTSYPVSVNPGRPVRLSLVFPADLW